LLSLATDVVREYNQAVQEAPELVWSECRVTFFLSSNQGNTLAAARRVAQYWKTRKELFGPDRWLRPMNQTGYGALDSNDIAILRSGYVAAIYAGPNSENLVVLVDRSRLPRQPGLSEARLAFYWCALHTGAPINVIYRIHVVTSAPRPPVELDTAAVTMFQAALPIARSRNKIIVAQACESSGKQALVEYLGYQTQREVQYRVQREVPRVAAISVGQTRCLLQSHGVDPEALPPCLGGTFDYRRFDDFVRERLTVENAMSAAPLQANFIPTIFDRHQNGAVSAIGQNEFSPTTFVAEDTRVDQRTRQENSLLAFTTDLEPFTRPPNASIQNSFNYVNIACNMITLPPPTTTMATGISSVVQQPRESDLFVAMPDNSLRHTNNNNNNGRNMNRNVEPPFITCPDPPLIHEQTTTTTTATTTTPMEAKPKPSVDPKIKPRMYQRQKEDIARLQKEQHDLEKRNAALRQSNRQLEGALAQARFVAAVANTKDAGSHSKDDDARYLCDDAQ